MIILYIYLSPWISSLSQRKWVWTHSQKYVCNSDHCNTIFITIPFVWLYMATDVSTSVMRGTKKGPLSIGSSIAPVIYGRCWLTCHPSRLDWDSPIITYPNHQSTSLVSLKRKSTFPMLHQTWSIRFTGKFEWLVNLLGHNLEAYNKPRFRIQC